MKRILMVCLGNICRSPLAEGILKSKVNSETHFIDSAGTAAYHVGNSPDERSIAVAAKYGISISHQKARKFNIEDFDNFDVIYAMDEDNYKTILKLSRNHVEASKLKLILNEITPNANRSVPDPYYGGDEGFETVFKMLEKASLLISNKTSNDW